MRRSLLLALALCLAGAGCRGDDAGDATTTTTTQPVTTTTALRAPVALDGQVNLAGVKDFSGVGTNVGIEYSLDDFSFNPTFVKVLPGTKVTFQLENLGSVDHTFTMDELEVDQTVTPSNTLEGEVTLPEGTFNVAQATTTTAPDAAAEGIFEFYCKFHRDQGMRGAFYYQEGASIGSESPAPESSPTAGGGSSSGSGSRTTARRSSGSGSGATAASAQNRPGDLVIPDVDIGGTTLRAASTTRAAAATTRPPVTTTRPRSPQPPAPTGAPGQPSQDGKPGGGGGEGDEGDEGEAGEDGQDVISTTAASN